MVFHISMIPLYIWNGILWALSTPENFSLGLLYLGGFLVATGVLAKLIVCPPAAKKATPKQFIRGMKVDTYIILPGLVLLIVGVLLFAIVEVIIGVGGVAW
jgi:hypothetical protein